MKVILDLDDNILADMHLYADIQNKSLNELIEFTFLTFIKTPKKALFNLMDEEEREVDFFFQLLEDYLNKMIEELSVVKNNSYLYDYAMHKVFTVLKNRILNNDEELAILYEEFTKQNEHV